MRVAVLATCTVLAVNALAMWVATNPDAGDASDEVQSDRDRFGIRKLYPTSNDGMTWMSSWNRRRAFSGVDPADPWFDGDHGSGAYKVENGKLHIRGRHPRMHVHDPSLRRQWRDVEITMYFKRVADSDVRYAGMVAVARTNHGVTGGLSRDRCDTRGVGARMRYDGWTDFEKETAHPENDAVAGKVRWSGGLARGTWIGYKFVVYDLPGGAVRLELWGDQTNGRDGGHWERLNEFIDDGSTFGDKPCAKGIDPLLALTNRSHRPGSESGKPNLSVYFRTDGLRGWGLVYKWGSIREIAAPPPAQITRSGAAPNGLNRSKAHQALQSGHGRRAGEDSHIVPRVSAVTTGALSQGRIDEGP